MDKQSFLSDYRRISADAAANPDTLLSLFPEFLRLIAHLSLRAEEKLTALGLVPPLPKIVSPYNFLLTEESL